MTVRSDQYGPPQCILAHVDFQGALIGRHTKTQSDFMNTLQDLSLSVTVFIQAYSAPQPHPQFQALSITLPLFEYQEEEVTLPSVLAKLSTHSEECGSRFTPLLYVHPKAPSGRPTMFKSWLSPITIEGLAFLKFSNPPGELP